MAIAPWVAPVLSGLGTGIQNIFNARQATRQMAFQERMSSTAYQRSRADMLAAGMNPFMAHSMGGAQSGSGASAQMGNDPLSAGVSSALSSTLMRAQIRKTEAEATSAYADAAVKMGATSPGEPTYRDEVMARRRALLRDLEFGGVRNDMERTRFSWDKARQPVDQQRAELELRLRGLDENEAQAYSGYYGRFGWAPLAARDGGQLVKDLAGAVGSVGGVVNGAKAAKNAADAIRARAAEGAANRAAAEARRTSTTRNFNRKGELTSSQTRSPR